MSTTVSVVLVKEEDKVKKLVYYVSKVLIGAKTRYLKIEKFTYALMITTRKMSLFLSTSYCCTYEPTPQADSLMT